MKTPTPPTLITQTIALPLRTRPWQGEPCRLAMRLARRLALPLFCVLIATPMASLRAADDAFAERPESASALTFSDVSATAGISENNLSWGSAWGDYDGDGYIDIFTVGHLGGICQLWHNNANGTFTDVTAAAGMLTEDGDAHGPCWVDLDNDGDLDLYVAKGTLKTDKPINYSDLYRNNGNGTFTNIASASGVTGIDHRSRGCSAIDFDDDGDLDLFIPSFFKQDEGEPNLLFRNDGNFVFMDVAVPAGIGRSGIGNWGAAWTDYDLDGFVDVFITTGPDKGTTSSGESELPSHALYRNLGNGTFQNVTAAAGIALGLSNNGAWGDYNNDGYPDLYVAAEHAAILYRNNGDGTFTDATRETGTRNTFRALGADWGDYDNDGNLDLYVVNASRLNILFRNNGNGTFRDVAASTGVTAAAGGNGSDATFIDYNNDGFLDLFVCNGSSTPGPYLLFNNNGNTNHWLKIILKGQGSNHDGVGARITLTAAGRNLYRQYSGQHGVAQNHIPVHFGLKAVTLVTLIAIDWPSGVHQELTNVAADQTIVVTEPAADRDPGLR